MNAPAQIASILRDASAELEADNAKARRVQEARMESMLIDYIDNTGKLILNTLDTPMLHGGPNWHRQPVMEQLPCRHERSY